MAISGLRLEVMRQLAACDALPVAVLVRTRVESGRRVTVARAALSRSLRRLWRLGAVELRGRRASLTLGQATASLYALDGARRRRRLIARIVREHLYAGLRPSLEPVTKIYARTAAITVIGRELLAMTDRGAERIWRRPN